MNLTANRAGHFGLLAVFAAFTVWFALDAWRADPGMVNMILIAPVAALTLAIVIAVAAHLAMNPDVDAESPRDEDDDGSLRARYGIAIACVMLAAYVLSLEVIGFDLAGIIFCGLTMTMMGQRGWAGIAVYSAVMGLAPVYVLVNLMGVPVKTVFLGG